MGKDIKNDLRVMQEIINGLVKASKSGTDYELPDSAIGVFTNVYMACMEMYGDKSVHCYPGNILTLIGFSDEDIPLINTVDFESYMINHLLEREVKVLQYVFKDGRTLASIGETYNVSTERIREIKMKAITKLNHSSIRRELKPAGKLLDESKLELEQLTLEYGARVRDLHEKLSSINTDIKLINQLEESVHSSYLAIHRNLSVKLEDMGLSTKAYNCLYRAGLKSISDIIEFCKYNNITDIRNLGELTKKEIVNRLKDYGVDISAIREGTI